MNKPEPISHSIDRVRAHTALVLAWDFLDDWNSRLTARGAEAHLPDFLRALGYLEHQVRELIEHE